MPSTIAAMSTEFEPAAARAVGVLSCASAHLQDIWNETADLRDQSDLLYLSSVAQLAACRGWHFISDDMSPELSIADVDHLVDELVAAHNLLIDHVTGLDRVRGASVRR